MKDGRFVDRKGSKQVHHDGSWVASNCNALDYSCRNRTSNHKVYGGAGKAHSITVHIPSYIALHSGNGI